MESPPTDSTTSEWWLCGWVHRHVAGRMSLAYCALLPFHTLLCLWEAIVLEVKKSREEFALSLSQQSRSLLSSAPASGLGTPNQTVPFTESHR